MSDVIERAASEGSRTRFKTISIAGLDGHASFGWDSRNDEQVLPWITRLMGQGYVFWIARRDPLREEQLRRIEDVGDDRHIIIRDEMAMRLFRNGTLGLVREDDDDDGEPVHTVRRARTPEEVVQADATVTHRPLAGG